MRVALVNLPHRVPVVRRYMCSYNSPIFLFPPLELLYAASAVREWGGHDVKVIDAIARRDSIEGVGRQLADFGAELVLTIAGFEIFEEDMRAIGALRDVLPDARLAVFGHYPTTFPQETLEASRADFVLRGEPEYTLHELAQALEGVQSLKAVAGLTYRSAEGVIVSNPDRGRTRHVDELPHPDYGLVDIHAYSEFLLPTPFAVIQTTRGCPYTCNFCVHSYGQKLGMRSPDNIVEELTQLVERFAIRSFRIIDDTFTAIPERTFEICRRFREDVPQLVWSCLSRVDTLDEARVRALGESGCRRVYLGIESGSPRILKLYGKDYGIELVGRHVELLRRHKIEVGAFFMVGHPEETAEDFALTSQLVRSLRLDYAAVGQTIPYPGTPLYDAYRDQIDFTLFPYRNEWKNPARRLELEQWEKQLYRSVYFQLPYLARHAARFIKHPATTLAAGRALVPFLFGSGKPDELRNELI